MRIAIQATLVALTMFAAPAVTAQVLTVPDTILQAGASTTINVLDPANANGTVTVTVKNGSGTNPDSQEIEVPLDANGNGTATWLVPDAMNWWSAEFKLPGANTVNRMIRPGPKPIGAE